MGGGGVTLGKTVKGGGGPEVDALNTARDDPSSGQQRARHSVAADQHDDVRTRILAARQRAEGRRREMLAVVADGIADSRAASQTISSRYRAGRRLDTAGGLHDRAAQVRLDLVTAVQARAVPAPDQTWDERTDQLERAGRSHGVQLEAFLQMFHRWASDRATSALGHAQRIDRSMAGDQAALCRSHRDALHPMMSALRQGRAELGTAVDDSDQSWQAMKEAMKNKQAERLNNLQVSMAGLTEHIEQLFKDEYRRYMDVGGERAAEFEAMLKRDAALAAEIEQRAARITALLNAVEFWRNEQRQAYVICAQRNAELRDERNRVMGAYAQLKDEKGRKMAAANAACKQLSRRCQQRRRHLQQLVQQSSRIVTLAQQAAGRSRPGRRLMPARLDRGRAEALLGNRLLMERRQALLRENDDLRACLGRFLRETTVSGDSLDRPNSLLVVNGRMATPRPTADGDTARGPNSSRHALRPVCY